MPTASCSGVACASSEGPVAGSSIRRCAWVRFDSGRKMLPFVMKRCSSCTARLAAGGVDHRHARATVVGEHDHGLEAQHLGDVVLQHLDVAHEAVAPAERLVGEAEAGEVHRADAVAVAESLGDLEPVDAARREAVDQHERRARRDHPSRRGRPGPRRRRRHAVATRSTRPCHAMRRPGSCGDSVGSHGGRQPAAPRAGRRAAVGPDAGESDRDEQGRRGVGRRAVDVSRAGRCAAGDAARRARPSVWRRPLCCASRIVVVP